MSNQSEYYLVIEIFSIIIMKISDVLNAFDLLQNLVCFKLLSYQLDLVLSIKKLLFYFKEFILKLSIFWGVNIQLVLNTCLGNRISLSLCCRGLFDGGDSWLNLRLKSIFQKFVEFFFELFDNQIFFKDCFNKNILFLIYLCQRVL